MAGSRYLFLSQTFQKLLVRVRATGLCFNDKKLVVLCKRILCFGNIIGADGIAPDRNMQHDSADRSQGITDISLGLANYLGRFTPNLAEVSAPLIYFLQDERPLRLGTRTRCSIFKLEKGYLLK